MSARIGPSRRRLEDDGARMAGAGFPSAELRSFATGGADFVWNADDLVAAVAAPEPGGSAGAALGALAALGWPARRRHRVSTSALG